MGCNVEKANLINNMDTNGVKEYQERHKRKLDQAVNNNLAVDYKLFGLWPREWKFFLWLYFNS